MPGTGHWHFFAPPPFLELEGAYCLANVSRSVGLSVRPLVDQMVSDHYLENYLSQSFNISHANWSGLGVNMICIDFGITRSKVKVTRDLSGKVKKVKDHFCKKKWFPLIFLRTVYHRPFIFTCLLVLVRA